MSTQNQDLGAWAAAFLRQYEQEAQRELGADAANPQAQQGLQKYAGVTAAASALLESVDAGGVPAFVTANLLQIARDNGLQVMPAWTPNDIVDALRGLVNTGAPGQTPP